MQGPNFYTIDFARETVLQGKSTTFVTIGRVDANLSPIEDVFVILFPNSRTFKSYASMFATASLPAVGNVQPDVFISGYTSGVTPNVLGFNNIDEGFIIKNSWSNGFINIDEDLVIDTIKDKQSWNYIADIKSATALNPPTLPIGMTVPITVGKWEDHSIHWKINGQTVDELEKIAYGVPPSVEDSTTLPNIFDGSIETFPSGFLDGTGYVMRSAVGWGKLPYDSKLENPSLTFRIDFDGDEDAHLKFNLIIFKRSITDVGSPLNYRAPLYVPESYTGTNNPTTSYVNQPYGPKTGAPSTAISNTVDFQELHFFGYKQTPLRTHRDSWQNEYVSDNKIYDDRSSYSLLKTNPKLSGNVKLTLDSTGNLWMNSIDANNELADSAYKKYPISPQSTYARDLYKFFKNGQTPPSIVYSLYQVDDQYQNTKRTLAEQYDNFYNYGVEQLKNKYYDENFSFFAPLWLRKNVPDFFIIFRLDHPVSPETYKNMSNTDVFNEFFKDARIVKTFDMREKSYLGMYLRKIVNDPRFNERALNVSFDSDVATTWSGVSYADGTMTGKGEFLSDYWAKDRPIIELEEYITSGFERHGIISTNLINLEFLFDDEEATPYSINRYFGLYVTENQLANFQIDPEVLGKIPNQSPLPKPGVDGQPYSTKEFIQTNPDGIQIPVHYFHNPSGIVNNTNVPSYQGPVEGKFPLPEFVEDPLRIFYVKDRDDAFKRITALKEVDYGNPGTRDYRRVTQIGLFDNQEDISKYAGVNQITSQFTASLLEKGNSQLRLHLAKVDGDKVLADEEEIILTFNQFNHDPRNHEYVLKLKDVSSTVISFVVFKDQYTQKLATPLTMPAIGGTIAGIAVNDPTAFYVGQQVYITGPGLTVPVPPSAAYSTYGSYFTVKSVDALLGTIDIVNNGNPTNVAPLTLISTDEYLSISGPTSIATYNYSPVSTILTIDPLLTINILDYLLFYSLNASFTINVNSEKVITSRNQGSGSIESIVKPSYQQFRWKMIANEVGLIAGDAWDYPVADPNGYDYVTTFSNEGTEFDVAQALAKAINSFENRPCNAIAIDDIIYLKAVRPGFEGNSIELTRKMVDGKSNIYNLGFYEESNAETFHNIEDLKYVPSNPDIFPVFTNKIGTVGSTYTYLKISKTPTGSYVQIRLDVDATSLSSASTTGSAVYYVTSNTTTVFNDPAIPFSVDLTDLSDYVFYEYVIKLTVGPNEIKQLFVGGTDRNRNRARIGYVDSERYFSDRRTKVTGNIITGSTIIPLGSLNNFYIGAAVVGTGIPEHTTIVSIDTVAKIITINNPATLGTTTEPYATELTIGDLSILNDTTIKDQWYQTQKGKYSEMVPWNIQGKYAYSLPNLEEPVYDKYHHIVNFNNLGEYSIIELEDQTQEFYQTRDKRIVAYDIYRPIVGIFSIFPIKEFDFDFYFSDYSYTPILEALRYYFNEYLSPDGSYLILPPDENYLLTLVDDDDTPVNTGCWIDIEGLNPVTNKWDKVESLHFTGLGVAGGPTSAVINTYYPLYVYDINENPHQPGDVDYWNGAGKRNYMKRPVSVTDESGVVSEVRPILYRTKIGQLGAPATKIKFVKNDYSQDKDLKVFPGFAAISDIYSPEDAEAIRGLLNDEKYVDAFLLQALRSEYDRLRENFNKDYALKSKVVPYINKWVQEGTDARDNYYRLNTSRAFGISNLSPDTNVNFAEPSLLTNEFPYLDTVPKDYPTESLEGSRSYMFTKLSDVAKTKTYNNVTTEYSWFDLITKDIEEDWFTKYFAVGYPTERDQYGNLIPKSRDERYTFFLYNDGIKRAQTLFRGGKIQILDLNERLIPPTEITESTRFNDYKFSAIARILPQTPYQKEKPVDIEVYCNDKFKSIVMIVNIHLQDYRVQSGLADYLFLYAMTDQLKNYNQMQIPMTGLLGVSGFGFQDNLTVTDFLPYNNVTNDTYTDLSILRPRQGFFGGGYLELGDTRLGGLVVEQGGSSNPDKPVFNPANNSVILKYMSVDSTYEFSVLNEIIPTLDKYTNIINSWTVPTSTNVPNVTPVSLTTDGSIFKLINAFKVVNSIKHMDRTNSKSINDQYLPLQTVFGGTNKPNSSSITPGLLLTANYGFGPGNFILPGVVDELETFNIKGGTSAYTHIKNLITYASLKDYINSDSPFIEYYKVVDGTNVVAKDYKLRIVQPDQIVKTGTLAYVNDEDKPIEYVGAPIIGYNIVDTNQNEVVYRHRGNYEPKANDILSFWVREDQKFTSHFNKDFLLENTHFNIQSPLSGILRNYGINKVADAEILKIKGGGAYKSVYPLVGEVSIDSKQQFILNSTWDKHYYRRYYELTSWDEIDGIEEMKEFKSFMGSKVMNIPKTQVLDTFNSTEATYTVTEPSQVVGVKQLKKTSEVKLTDVQGSTKPLLTINLDLKERLLRKLYEDISLSTSFDEFNWLTTLGVTELQSLTSTDIETLKKEYLNKNIIQLYRIDQVVLYALSKEGIPIFEIEITDAEKISGGYRVDKDCKVTNVDEFTVKITKELDTKKPFGYAVSATIKRI